MLLSIGAGSPDAPVRVDARDGSVRVYVAERLFTVLNTDAEARKPYLHPLNAASGTRVTRAFPMETVKGESTDHPHQRGVWIGAEDLSGNDFWENERSYDRPRRGTVALTGITDVRSGAADGGFSLHANWTAEDGAVQLVEDRAMRFSGTSRDRTIDIDLRLTARVPVTFADNHDAILGLRLGTAFEEGNGGKAVNAEGVTGWERLRGTRSAWVDWNADVAGERIGVAVMDHPENFRFPTPWHVRDYALLFASPFAFRDYSPKAPDGSLAMKVADQLRLRYRIFVHGPDADVAAAFRSFSGR